MLKAREKALRDNIPIRFNDWSSIGGSDQKDVPKHLLVKFSVYTDSLMAGGVLKKNAKATSISTKMFQKLERIEDNPKAVIKVW